MGGIAEMCVGVGFRGCAEDRLNLQKSKWRFFPDNQKKNRIFAYRI